MPDEPFDPSPSEGERRYETLFESMAEGFALCEAIFDDRGDFVDYTILEINPALQAMLGVGPEVAGRRLSDGPVDRRWMAACARVLGSGEPIGFEFHNPVTGRWHEIRVNRVGARRLAQFFFDVTDRKLAQSRQQQLFDELNHRVKNNLTMVASLLQLQARGAAPVERAGLLKAVDRLQSVAAVHESLYSGHRLNDVEFGDYLRDLCERLARSLLGEGGVRLEVEAASETVSIDRAAPLGMIVNELVTNAVKYAYPSGSGEIRVRLWREGADLLLAVSDAGVGLPPGWSSRAGSLGMRLVDALVRQIGGSLAVSDGPGAGFTVRFPAALPP